MTAHGDITRYRDGLNRSAEEFGKALPPQIPVDRFIRTAITTVQMNPSITKCDYRSFIGACMKAAQDGLMLDGREAALVTFGTMCSYLPMTAGILKKLRQSGELVDISVRVVYEADDFSYEFGDGERIVHKPSAGDRGNPTYVYAIVRTKAGGTYREVMSFADIEEIRKRSRSGTRGPWVTDWSEMAKKTVIRRLAKLLPSSTDYDSIVAYEDDTFHSGGQDGYSGQQEAAQGDPKPRLSRLRASLARTAQVMDGPHDGQEVTDAEAVPVPDAV
jgi:recombination protein RecT